MRFTPGDGVRTLDCYEVGDSDILGIANEHGDITAYVRRADGTHGHAYGGPVYNPQDFENVCALPPCGRCDRDGRCPIAHGIRRIWLTDAELAMATALARKVGWL